MGKMTSIVILSYNTLSYLQYCIESVRRFTAAGSYELIVVENASKDGSAEWLRQQADIHTIFNAENAGFPKGCNQGMKVAQGDDILLLNSDTIVAPNWLENLKKALYSREQIGAVSCVTNACSNLQSIAVPYKNIDEMLDFAAAFNQSNPRLWEPRLRLIGFCFLFKREVYHKIGGLDERFSPGNYEDDDYSLRIWQAGYELLLCRDTFIHHFGSASFQKDENPAIAREKRERFKKLAARNKEKFLDKWQVPANYQELGLKAVFPGWQGREVVSCRELWDFAHKKTRISAIIAVYNNLEETQDCLQILHCLLAPYPHEIIVIDNGSELKTSQWLIAQAELTVIRNEQNLGMAAAWNQGAQAAQGDVLLFLHSDAILSEHCVERMLDVLIHQQAGAVGPYFSHSRYFQKVPRYKAYRTYAELQQNAELLEQSLEPWEGSLMLESVCLMMKREIYQQVGHFDEQFHLPGWEDWDYSIRLQKAGLLLYKVGTFVHHGTGSFQENGLSAEVAYNQQKKDFMAKWKLNPDYYSQTHQDMLGLMEKEKHGLNVLEIGCAMGANFLWLKEHDPSIKCVGIELNPIAADVARNFGDIHSMDVEELDVPAWKGKFDYILAGDVLEYLKNPWEMVAKLRKLLRPEGRLIASLPNVMFFGNVFNLLSGEWKYEDAGILDRTHLRFFTRKSIERMLLEAGFAVENIQALGLTMSESDKDYVIEILKAFRLSGISMADDEQFMAYQWLVVAQNRTENEWLC